MSHERDNSRRHAAKIDRWYKRFDDLWTHLAQKREFRNYIGGLLGESERKNLYQIASNAVGVTEKKGFQASPFKGNHQKILPNVKLRPLKAEPIQNPKSKIQNRLTYHRLHHFLTEAPWSVEQVLGAPPAGDESVISNANK